MKPPISKAVGVIYPSVFTVLNTNWRRCDQSHITSHQRI